MSCDRRRLHYLNRILDTRTQKRNNMGFIRTLTLLFAHHLCFCLSLANVNPSFAVNLRNSNSMMRRASYGHKVPLGKLYLKRARETRETPGWAMSLWTQISDVASTATSMCVSACIIAPVFYSGFGISLKVVKEIDKSVSNFMTSIKS